MEYNGWKNYETWSVALILDNDEDLQRAAMRVVEDAIAFGAPSSVWSEDERRRFRSAEYLREWIEQCADAEGITDISVHRPLSYLWSQLVTAAMSEVDWDEVAGHYLDALAEQES